MTNIKGSKCTTFAAASGGIYALELACGRYLDIVNATTGDLLVAEKNDFSGNRYISIPSGGSYNSFPLERGNVIYLKSKGSGNVSVLMRRDK